MEHLLNTRHYHRDTLSSLVGQMVKNLAVMKETQVQSLEEVMATHPTPVFLPEEFHREASQAIVHGVTKSRTRLNADTWGSNPCFLIPAPLLVFLV